MYCLLSFFGVANISTQQLMFVIVVSWFFKAISDRTVLMQMPSVSSAEGSLMLLSRVISSSGPSRLFRDLETSL